MTQYQLLRNNKESGPFTATDLIKMGMKPYDLVWTIGKSAAWRYPSEVDELKAYAPIVEEQPFDRFYKKPQIKKVAEPVLEQETVIVKPAINELITAVPVQPEAKQPIEKPRIRIKADWKRIDNTTTDTNSQETVEIKSTNNISVESPEKQKAPGWQAAYTSWENTRLTTTAGKQQPIMNLEPDEAPRTSFYVSNETTSTDSLGTKPISFLQQNKAAIGIAASFILLLTGGYLVSSYLQHKNEVAKTKPQAEIQQQATLSNPAMMQENEIQPADETKTVSPVQAVMNEPKVQVVPVRNTTQQKSQPVVLNKKSNNTIPFNQPGTKTLNKNSVIPDTKNTAPVKITNVPNTSTASNNINTAKATLPKKATTDNAVIQKYIDVQPYIGNSGDASDRNYEISNISQTKLDLVMIDLQYFDATGRYQKGQTVYVKNLSPNQKVTIAPPDAKQAAKITCKVSLVSAPQNNLYLIGD